MQVSGAVPADHDDLIHDVAYDFYGRRLATCAADRRIKVWDQNPTSGAWECTASWIAHQGPVWKIEWAHPQFGQVLASCSFDRTVCIWEELGHSTVAAAGSGSETKSPDSAGNLNPWKLRAPLRDSRDTVSDISFAPHHLGFQLATASGDGYVRVYQPEDVMDLEHWQIHEFEASGTAVARDLRDLEVVGGGNLMIAGEKAGTTADGAGADTDEQTLRLSRGTRLTSVAWCAARFNVPLLAVAAKDASVRVWSFNQGFRRWQILHDLRGHSGAVHAVCWAPDTGRSYHLLATASQDGNLGFWSIDKTAGLAERGDSLSDGAAGGEAGAAGGEVVVASAAHGEERTTTGRASAISPTQMVAAHQGKEVWRVRWDVSGSQVASSGDDGMVRLWRKKIQEMAWENFDTISADQMAPPE